MARENLVKRGIATELVRVAELDKAALSQLNDLIVNPDLGHVGKDGANLRTRTSRQGLFSGPIAENITVSDVTPRQVVLSMLIDDGVPTRQHRENILNPAFRLIGTACNSKTNNKPMCVVIFATRIRSSNSKPA